MPDTTEYEQIHDASSTTMNVDYKNRGAGVWEQDTAAINPTDARSDKMRVGDLMQDAVSQAQISLLMHW